jgi:hypothetical protein
MRTHLSWKWAGIAVLALGMWWLAGAETSTAADDKEAPLPIAEADFNKLVDQNVKIIQKTLGETKSKVNTNKARAAAIMIAAYAQYGQDGASAEQRATLRDAALKLAGLIEKGKTDDAKKAADALAGLKADAKAKPGPVPILKQADVDKIDIIMRQFNIAAVGGYGIENHYKKLTGSGGTKKELPAAAMNDDLMLMAYRTAAIAELVKEFKPDKNAKDFQRFAEDTRLLAVALAQATKKKDGPAALAVVYKLTISCNKCHDKFKD